MARDPEMISRIAPLAVAWAVKQGHDGQALLARHRLPQDLNLGQLNRAEVTIKMSTLRALNDEIAGLLADAHLGLSLARSAPRGTFGVTEFLARSSVTLAQAIDNFLRFNQLINPGLRFASARTRAEATVEYSIPGVTDGLGRHGNEFVCAALWLTLRTMLPTISLSRVFFENPAPAALEPLREFFGTTKLDFEAGGNGIAFASGQMEQQLVTADAALAAYLEENAVAALKARPQSDDLVERLRHALQEALKTGEPNIERLSTRLHMSARTLQRRLSEQKTSFQEVLDGVRYELARSYLKDVKLDVSQVAYLLGYSELRAFDRAFRRWAGQAPTEWRSGQRGAH